MIDVAVLRAMVAAGAPVEAILAAIEADQRAEIERVQARRLAAVERQRRHRHTMSREHVVTRRDGCDADPSLTSSLSSSNTSQNLEEKKEKKERRARSQTYLPDDWAPKETHFEKAAKFNLSARYVGQKAEDMRNWAKSKGIRRADWDATFHGFLRPKENDRVNGHGSANPTMAAFDRLIDRAESEASEFGAPMRDITPGRT